MEVICFIKTWATRILGGLIIYSLFEFDMFRLDLSIFSTLFIFICGVACIFHKHKPNEKNGLVEGVWIITISAGMLLLGVGIFGGHKQLSPFAMVIPLVLVYLSTFIPLKYLPKFIRDFLNK